MTIPGWSVALVLTGVSLLLMTLETALYFIKEPWYFRFGPALHHEEWQTSAPPAQARAALELACRHSNLSVRAAGDTLCMRFAFHRFSAWPRVILRIEERDGLAVLVYEVRPFLSMVLFGAGMLWLSLGGIGIRAIFWLSQLCVLYVIVVYVGCWYYELRKLRRLEPIREKLSAIGVQVCSDCGYDRHRLAAHQLCPECGTAPRQH